MSRETPASITLGTVVRACDTSRGRRTSVRHITESAYERATHHGVGVRHITGSAYERATHHRVGVRAGDTSRCRRTSVRHITGSAFGKQTSGIERRRERDVTMRNVVRYNYAKGMRISCDLNAQSFQSLVMYTPNSPYLG